MRNRTAGSVVMAALVAAMLALVGVVALPGVSQAAKPVKAAKKLPLYYLSLGDSYSIGYQPNLPGGGGSPGYTAYVAKKEKMTLENFGCGGATTSSIINATGCSDPAATDAVAYPTTTQSAAALSFINHPANHGRVGLVTISIGGNDVTACAAAGGTLAAIVACVQAADTGITDNVTSLVTSVDSALAAAGDTTARVIGLTYPDVILGDWVHPQGATNTSLATNSVTAFDVLINPTLSAAYGAANFVNVTQAPYKEATSGDDTPLSTVLKVKPYGVIPAAVDEICQITYFCTLGNIHATTKGYKFIGQLIVARLGA